jgi:hypothetical protein
MQINHGTGLVPTQIDFDPEEEGWNQIRRPSGIQSQFIALAITIFIGFAAWISWLTFTPVTTIWIFPTLKLMLLFIPLIVVHEFLHVIVHPSGGLTSKTYLGFYAPRLAFYAHYSGQRSRTRFLLGILFPLFILSATPLFLSSLLKMNSSVLAAISFWNALFSSGDLLSAGLLLFKVPTKAIILTDQNKAWWKI